MRHFMSIMIVGLGLAALLALATETFYLQGGHQLGKNPPQDGGGGTPPPSTSKPPAQAEIVNPVGDCTPR